MAKRSRTKKPKFQSDEPCRACGMWGPGMVCLHHVISQGARGPSIPENLLPMCQKHHNEIHQKGLNYMAETYPQVKAWLEEMGWEYDEFPDKWKHANVKPYSLGGVAIEY